MFFWLVVAILHLQHEACQRDGNVYGDRQNSSHYGLLGLLVQHVQLDRVAVETILLKPKVIKAADLLSTLKS